MKQNNTPKFVRVLNKKPRASKTSKRHNIGGLDFFFKCSTAYTGGAIMIFYDKPPFPFIKVINQAYHYSRGGWYSNEEITEIAKKWCIDNHPAIITKLKDLDTYIKIDEESWIENESRRNTK